MKSLFNFKTFQLVAVISLTATGLSAVSASDKEAAAVSSKFFETDTKDLPEIVPTQEIQLKDGDSFEITAAPAKQKINGKWIRRLAYNRMIPGPLLRVHQGATVHVTLKNQLSIDTTLHPHGLRGDPKYDGIPGIGQPPIKPGSSYEYVLNFIDYGMYWYHPHIRDDYTEDMGLYGAIIVQPKADGALRAVDREIPVVVDDIDLSPGGTSYRRDVTTHTLMGRYGSTYLVNGTVLPEFYVAAGARIRFYVLNVANSRVFRFAIPGVPLTLVGGDNGRMQATEPVEAVTIGPGERYLIEATAPSKVSDFDIMNAKPNHPVRLARMKVIPAPQPIPAIASQESTVDAPLFSTDELARFRGKAAGPVDYALRLNVIMDHNKLPMNMKGGHQHPEPKSPAAKATLYQQGRTTGIEWDDDMGEMNRKSTDESVAWQMIDEADQKVNMAINWSLKKGNLYHIRIKNALDSMHPMQHPIHFHGQRFLVMSINGEANPNLGWKDTVLLGKGDVADLVLEATHPGAWMAHCHILEHIGAGMMMGFSVTE